MARKPVEGPVVKSTRLEFSKLPKDLADGVLAASALELARGMDAPNSLTSKSMAQRAIRETLDRLRELAPAEETHDDLDEISAARARRLAARRSTGSN